MRLLFVVTSLFFLSGCNPPDKRKRLVILETGVNITSEIAPFLCKDGHKSFLSNSRWNEDKIGHGTLIVKVIAERLDPKQSCIIVYKTADHGVESKIRAEAYATALVNLTKKNSSRFSVVLIALEDVSYFYKEIEWFDAILLKSEVQIVVAAGNDGVELRENKECSIYPACLRNHLSNKKKFHVIGSSDGNFNKGPLITSYRKSEGLGSSLAAARYASELMD